MQLTISEINNFKKMYERMLEWRINFRVVYAFTKIYNETQAARDAYNASFKQILEKYALKDDHGAYIFSEDNTSIKIKENLEQECMQEITDLNNQIIEIPDIEIPIESLESLSVTPAEMLALIKFVKE